jgi:adenylosuccinate lyase
LTQNLKTANSFVIGSNKFFSSPRVTRVKEAEQRDRHDVCRLIRSTFTGAARRFDRAHFGMPERMALPV